MTYNLAGRNAIVTGSARGLGAQFALDLAKAGANVLLVSIPYMMLSSLALESTNNLQNYTSPSSVHKAEAVMNEIRKVNPNGIVGAVQADVLSKQVLFRRR